MNPTFSKTKWSLNEMLSCDLFEYFMLISDLFKLLRSPMFLNVNHLQGIQILSIFLSNSIDFSKRSLTQEFQNFKIFQGNILTNLARTFRGIIVIFVLIFIFIRITFFVKHDHRFNSSGFSSDYLWLDL